MFPCFDKLSIRIAFLRSLSLSKGLGLTDRHLSFCPKKVPKKVFA